MTATKVCRKCGEEKPLGEFHKHRGRKDGLQPVCKPCKCAWAEANSERVSAAKCRSYRKHRERIRQQRAERYAEERAAIVARVAAWRKTNPDKVRAQRRLYWGRHPGKARAFHSRRRAKMRAVTWGDPAAIRVIYAKAKEMSEATGAPHHVDHIVPLNGKNVTGLHWEANLQILPALRNQVKAARFDPNQDFLPPEVRNFVA